MQIQFLQCTPEELTDLIKEGLKPEIIELIKQHSETKLEGSEFLTRIETCDYLKISTVTLHDWMKKGIVKPYKMGNRTYFLRAELKEGLLNSNPKK